jgi:hypothetical protein
MDRHGGPHTAPTVALHGDLYLSMIMDRHDGPHNTLTIPLYRGL